MRRICGWMVAAAVAGAMLSGCKPSESAKHVNDGSTVPGAPAPQRAPLDPATLGTASGTVRFAGKAPQRVKIDMSQDPVCSMTGGDNFAEQ